MTEPTAWRELHRTSDPQELLSVVTSIAAMEFEVRCVDVHGNVVSAAEAGEGQLCIVQVRSDDHAALLDVLSEIIKEQAEFDERLTRDKPWTLKRLIVALLALAGVVIVLWLSSMPH